MEHVVTGFLLTGNWQPRSHPLSRKVWSKCASLWRGPNTEMKLIFFYNGTLKFCFWSLAVAPRQAKHTVLESWYKMLKVCHLRPGWFFPSLSASFNDVGNSSEADGGDAMILDGPLSVCNRADGDPRRSFDGCVGHGCSTSIFCDK